MNEIGFAILGAGMIAENHRQAVLANADLGARLVAVGHYHPTRYNAVAAQFGVPCMSYDDLLKDPAVDVVCICTPNGQHSSQAIQAAKAGKHVLVEKPMAIRLDDADAMIAACNETGVKLGVTFQSRTKPLYSRMYEAIQVGDLGELTLGVVTIPYYRPMTYFNQAEWRGTWALDGGGVLMNQGIHQVDLLVWLMGDPVGIQAFATTSHRDIEVEDTLAAALRFANGAMATITATTTTENGFPHRVEIYGTRGGIQTEGDTLIRWQLADPTRTTTELPKIGTVAGAGAGGDPRGIGTESHIALFRDFIEAIRDDRPALIDGLQGRRSLATVLGIYQAAGIIEKN